MGISLMIFLTMVSCMHHSQLDRRTITEIQLYNESWSIFIYTTHIYKLIVNHVPCHYLDKNKSLQRTLVWHRLAENQTLQITNQVEAKNEEGPVTYKGDVPLALYRNWYHDASSVIAVSGYSYSFNCQQCDYKASCQSHMRQRVKNVHEGFKYDCTSCDCKSWDKGNLNKHIQKKHLGITYTCELCQHVFNLKEQMKHHVDVKFTVDCENYSY